MKTGDRKQVHGEPEAFEQASGKDAGLSTTTAGQGLVPACGEGGDAPGDVAQTQVGIEQTQDAVSTLPDAERRCTELLCLREPGLRVCRW